MWDEYGEGWNWKRIGLAALIVLVLAYAAYSFFSPQPQSQGTTTTTTFPAVDCSPFPNVVAGHSCVELTRDLEASRIPLEVCEEYAANGSCVKETMIRPSGSYALVYSKGDRRMDYTVVFFEKEEYAEKLFEKVKNNPYICPPKGAGGDHPECVDVSVDGAEGIYLGPDDAGSSVTQMVVFHEDGDCVLFRYNRKAGELPLSFEQLEELIRELKTSR